MREIVIVIGDLYLEPEPASPAAGSGDRGEAGSPLGSGYRASGALWRPDATAEGWRAWVARWLGLPQYAREAPASVAAAALEDAAAGCAVWLATPLHLIAGLTSVHVDRRSVLRLPAAELAELAASFRETFRGSGFELHPLAGGELLLSGPAVSAPSTTTEPARMLLTLGGRCAARGRGRAARLRRLSAEMEMWLHDHRVNAARARRGEPPVATLWFWGGGACARCAFRGMREGSVAAAFGLDAFMCVASGGWLEEKPGRCR